MNLSNLHRRWDSPTSELCRSTGSRASLRLITIVLSVLAFSVTLLAPNSASADQFTWHTPAPLDNNGAVGLSGVACPSASQCTAVAGLQEVTFNPASPGAPTPATIDTNSHADASLQAVSCPTATQCVTIDFGNDVENFDPAAPGTPTPVSIDADPGDGGGGTPSLVCPSSTQCVASSSEGNLFTFNPTRSARPRQRSRSQGIVRCSEFRAPQLLNAPEHQAATSSHSTQQHRAPQVRSQSTARTS